MRLWFAVFTVTCLVHTWPRLLANYLCYFSLLPPPAATVCCVFSRDTSKLGLFSFLKRSFKTSFAQDVPKRNNTFWVKKTGVTLDFDLKVLNKSHPNQNSKSTRTNFVLLCGCGRGQTVMMEQIQFRQRLLGQNFPGTVWENSRLCPGFCKFPSW